jgi:hypothetical protein
MRVLGVTREGADHQAAYIEPVLAATDAALAELSDEDTGALAYALEALRAAKDLSARLTPDPPRERATDGYTRALLM